MEEINYSSLKDYYETFKNCLSPSDYEDSDEDKKFFMNSSSLESKSINLQKSESSSVSSNIFLIFN